MGWGWRSWCQGLVVGDLPPGTCVSDLLPGTWCWRSAVRGLVLAIYCQWLGFGDLLPGTWCWQSAARDLVLTICCQGHGDSDGSYPGEAVWLACWFGSDCHPGRPMPGPWAGGVAMTKTGRFFVSVNLWPSAGGTRWLFVKLYSGGGDGEDDGYEWKLGLGLISEYG